MVKRQKADVFRGRRRIEVGKLGGGTLILPRRVYGVKRSMLCGVPRVTQDVQFYKMNSFCLKKGHGLKALLVHSHPNSPRRSKSLQSKFMSKEVLVN